MRLFVRFILAVTVVVVLALGVSLAVARRTQTAWAYKDLSHRSQLIATSAQDYLLENLRANRAELLTRYLSRLIEDERLVGAILCSRDGLMIAKSLDLSFGISCEEARRLAESGTYRMTSAESTDLFLVAYPIGATSGYFVLAHDTAFMTARFQKTRKQILSLFSSLYLIFVLSGVFLYNGARVDSIRNLRSLFRKVINGDLRLEPEISEIAPSERNETGRGRRIALIPARGGSKRIPGKNVKPFAGRPIIEYSIEAACRSRLFDRVIVSTDSEEIATVARAAGAEVPFLRPAEISDDHASTAAVISHGLDWLESHGDLPEYLCCIYPTAPFIQVGSLKRGWELLRDRAAGAVIPVTTFDYPVFRGLKMDSTGRLEMVWPEYVDSRSNDLPTAYHDAGSFYWLDVAAFRRHGTIWMPGALGLVLKRDLVHDIDTAEDWEIAEKLRQGLSILEWILPEEQANLRSGRPPVRLQRPGQDDGPPLFHAP